jgi:spermidine synthase
MTTSLFVEQQSNGVAFYINGELQFHSADEAVYHEYLTIPAIALAVQRFPDQDLRVLVCGGGDGLAVRDILRYSQVSHIDLVDYSQEVIDLGKQDFAAFNHDSLSNPKVKIHIHEAFAFLNRISQEFIIEKDLAHRYHAIICDFTYPASVTETQIYSWEWFDLLKRALVPSGIIATNAVSSDRNTLAFWCIYQTIQAAGFKVKPMQLEIPSFTNHNYGNWGFLLASEKEIIRHELTNLDLPPKLRALTLETLPQVFVFDQAIAKLRTSVIPHQRNSSQLFFYLLNRGNNHNSQTLASRLEAQKIDFLDLQDHDKAIAAIPNSLSINDPMSLEALAEAWLKQLESNPESLLIPAQHHSHTSEISQEWLTRVRQLLNQIDLSRLIAKLLERSQDLPQEIANDLRELQPKLIAFQKQLTQKNSAQLIYENSVNSETRPSFNLTTAKVIAILSLTLLVANLAAPDAVFAKGSTSYGGTGDGDISLGFIGLMMTMGGVYWLIHLANTEKKK